VLVLNKATFFEPRGPKHVALMATKTYLCWQL